MFGSTGQGLNTSVAASPEQLAAAHSVPGVAGCPEQPFKDASPVTASTRHRLSHPKEPKVCNITAVLLVGNGEKTKKQKIKNTAGEESQGAGSGSLSLRHHLWLAAGVLFGSSQAAFFAAVCFCCYYY